MANEYSDEDIWGLPAQSGTVLSDEDVWGGGFSEPLNLRAMSKEQLMEAYRNLPRDDPQRNMVRKAIVGGYTQGPQMTGTQSAIAGATDALSFGLSDEINAGIAGLTGGDYDAELGAQRQMMRNAADDNPGAYVGGQLGGAAVQAVATGGGSLWGTGAVRAAPAATWGGRAVQTARNVARPAAAAGVSGAVYGFNSGEGGVGNRLTNAAETGAMSAAFAPVAAGVSKSLGKTWNRMRGQNQIWSSEELEQTSQSLYRQATQAGAVVQPNTTQNVGRRMIAQVVGDENYDPAIPEAFTNARLAMNRVERSLVNQGGVPLPGGGVKMNAPKTLEELETLRRTLTKLAGKSQDDEARMIFNMRRTLDEAIDSLTPADMVNGDPAAFNVLRDARQLWRVKSETEWAEEMLQRAQNSAGQFSNSRWENAVRTQARQAGNNSKKMRQMPDEVVAATERVANPGMVQNLIRDAGKWSPFGIRGPMATALNPAVGVPLMAAGQAASIASGELTRRNFRNLQRTIQRALPPKDVPIPASERVSNRAIPFALPGLLSDEPFLIDAQGREYDAKGRRIK